ncbi:hypothetical protein G6N74_28550 [Mesorhizobium sp. CGMCC 1.15528]|uniref:Uncharacterized protein n=1 Tax=Mesorhizobium zhangyense TaxID=1776730 RepID=A0A7C9VI96_9HYPH|nr:hypothetical protein [Mesorhizobium zhangyense]NGN45011.1 hypothetical protein [Mesorhizobium zhangyense]
MSKVNRRNLLLSSAGAIIASTVVGEEKRPRQQVPSRELQALIETHTATYAAFGRAIHATGGKGSDHAEASRTEERALVALCCYPAVSDADRWAKAKYLLKIERRGELDLKEHMQAVLRSTMWRA